MTTRTYNNKVTLLPSADDSLIRKTELIISGVLRGGVLLSVTVIFGGVVYLYVQKFSSGLTHNTYPDTLRSLLAGLIAGNPISVIVFGLMILLATPVVRVAVSIVAFAIEEDRTYVVITSLVLV
ncbi:MAG: DUF1634 domain-containing protein, partial [Acetobacteraceae bacterium]